MTYIVDTETDLNPEIKKKYFFSPLHRGKVSKDKSRWTITLAEEIECFKNSHRYEWIENYLAWGIIIADEKLMGVGTNNQQEVLKIAKFIDSKQDGIWHGYPADYVRNSQDRPSTDVLIKWKEQEAIQKHHIVKIRQGKVCNL